MSNAVTCPSCRHEFEVTEVISAQLSTEIRKELEAEVASQRKLVEEQAAELRDLEAHLDERKTQIGTEVSIMLKKERKKLLAEAQRAATLELQDQILDSKQELETTRANLKEAQKNELELRRKERELQERADAMELEVARKLDEERSKYQADAKTQAEETFRLKLAENQLTMQQMRKQIDDLRRKSEQGSQQLQGEVLELELENTLTEAFPDDVVEPVAKGVNGGDAQQHVHTSVGRSCGSILWESKRTKNWSKAWLPKLRDDQRRAGAECAVIVTETLPENVKTFAHIDGVWVCGRQYAVPLAMALRAGIMEIAKARNASQGRNEKADQAYNYLCSAEFTHHLAAIVEAFAEMTSDVDSEERSAKSRFRKRRKQLERAFTGTTGLYGDLQGLIGNAMPEVQLLELDIADDQVA